LTIARLRELGSPAAALDDQTFLKHLYETLQSWGIGSRGSVLRPYPAFVSALQARTSEIAALGDLAIDQVGIDVAGVAQRLTPPLTIPPARQNSPLLRRMETVRRENLRAWCCGRSELPWLLPSAFGGSRWFGSL
jgi:hypothetical protein